jgi:hypothetical protein
MANFFQTSNVQRDPDQLDLYVPTVSTPIASSIGGDVINGQTEADYDGVGNNGTFVGGDGAGGTAYVAADTITLSDGTVITVDTVDGNGDVTEFTVTTVGGSNSAAAVQLTQSSTSGSGTSFSITPGTANISAAATEEIIIDWDLKKIALVVQGNLPDDGASLKAVYSALKDAWRTNSTLIKFPFPMGPITDEQFEMINGWNWDKVETSGTVSATTVELLRDGGWSVKDTSNVIQEEWAGIITLGTLGNTDQVYFQQIQDETSTTNTSDFKLFGAVNQAVQIYDNGVFDYKDQTGATNIFKLFVREWQSTFATSRYDDIGVENVSFQAYRFPLTTVTDLKVPHLEGFIADGESISASSNGTVHTFTTGSAHGLSVGEVVVIAGFTTETDFNEAGGVAVATIPSDSTFTVVPTAAEPNSTTDTGGTATISAYANITVTYVRSSVDNSLITNADVLGNWTSAGTYVIGNVVFDINDSEWYVAITNHDSVTTPPNSDGTNWEVFQGSRSIAGTNYPFTIIIDGDTTVGGQEGGGNNGIVTIYEKLQYLLRQNSDIDADGTGVVVGKTADSLGTFVGDTLVTAQGVYIDSFTDADTNSIEFTDAQNQTRLFNFIAQLTVNFGETLQDDEFAKFFVFFENDDAATAPQGFDFNTINAIIVEDKDNAQMAGDVNPAWPTKRESVTFSYDYDGNVQRGAGSQAKIAPIVVVGIGLSNGQYVRSGGSIARSKANTVSLIAALERNYDEGTVPAV